MYKYTVWPGAYSFKEEVSLFVLYVKEQCEEVLKMIEKTEETLEEQRLLKRICVCAFGTKICKERRISLFLFWICYKNQIDRTLILIYY